MPCRVLKMIAPPKKRKAPERSGALLVVSGLWSLRRRYLRPEDELVAAILGAVNDDGIARVELAADNPA